jgi:hypothetical protein
MLLTALALLQAVLPSDSARSEQFRHRNGTIPRTVTAVRVTEPPRIDGHLDDAVWRLAAPQRGFRRDVPSDGNPASDDTEVRVLFDRDALYVGARLFDKRPELVSRRLSRRDSFDDFNDAFFILIDSYHDHQTEFIFAVTPAGEKRDASVGGDGDFATLDVSFDPVWQVRTTLDSLGWTAEARIPFSQLRFPQAASQVWGIQFRRDMRRVGEAVDWQWSPKSEPGVTSKFGHLLGLSEIPAPKRIEVLPYVRSQAQLTQGADPANPFDDGSITGGSGGLDLKYGLTSNLTLSASLNPDFGQVEADPSVVNLTAFETFFEERRPLFVEGSNIFAFNDRAGRQRFFYSRRIGRAPTLSALGTATYVDEPAATSILGAAKLSGRTRSGWSIGALDAVTGRESARLANTPTGPVTRVPIEPLSNYGVLRIRRDLNGGGSGYGFIATSVNRDTDPTRFASVRSSAYTGAVDFFHRWNRNSHVVRGWFGGSSVHGEPAAIQEAQLSSARYFQRPDQDYVRFDGTARSLRGYAGEATVAKESGDWVYDATFGATSPGFELNDAGFQTDADRLGLVTNFGRRWLSPGKFARQANLAIGANGSLNYGGVWLNRELAVNAGMQTNSLIQLFGFFSYHPRSQDDRATRGGPLMERPAGWMVHGGFTSDRRKPVSYSVFGTHTDDVRGGQSSQIYTELAIEARSNIRISFTPQYDYARSAAFYVGDYADQTASATFGRRYVFAGLTQHTLSLSTRVSWYFTPDLTLQVYAQPFVATGSYDGYGAFSAPRSFSFSPYGTGGSTIGFDPAVNQLTVDADGGGPAPSYTFDRPDFRIRSLRSNVVLRWEYRPGSTLFLVWNQNRFNVGSDPRFRALRGLRDIFRDDMQNVFLVKLNYYLSR